MDNTIQKKVDGVDTPFIRSLMQWSYGQVLQIEGLTLPDGEIEVHFSLTEFTGNASTCIGTVKDNVITVKIPRFILEKENVHTPTYHAYAFIYQSDGDAGRTLKKIVFSIKARPKPDDYVYTEEEVLHYTELEQTIEKLIDRTLTEIESDIATVGDYAFRGCSSLVTAGFPQATSIGSSAFHGCSALTTVNIPQAPSIGANAFYGCSALTKVNIPQATSIGNYAFNGCSALTKVNIPQATSIGNYAFSGCSVLTKVDIPQATSIGGYAFRFCSALVVVDLPPQVTSIPVYAFSSCSALKAVILRSEKIPCTLQSTNAFTNTPIASRTGYIYVPSSLIAGYKVATNWTTYASRFRALEDYTVDGTITGELDETKI